MANRKGLIGTREERAAKGDVTLEEQARRDEFGTILAAYSEARGVTQRELGRLIGTDETYIGQLERASRWVPRRPTLERIAAALGLSQQERRRMFEAAGRPVPDDVVDRIPFGVYLRQDPNLTDPQRETLQAVYDQYVAANRKPAAGRRRPSTESGESPSDALEDGP